MRRVNSDPAKGVVRQGCARRKPRFALNTPECLEGRALLSMAVEGLVGVGSNANGATSIVSNAVATDAAGDRFVTGSFYGNVDFGGVTLQSAGVNDAFVAEYSANGSLIYAKKAGATFNDAGTGIAVDASGDAFVTGTSSTATGGKFFVWALNPGGSTKFATCVNTNGPSGSMGIAVDPSGANVAIGGSFSGSMTP